MLKLLEDSIKIQKLNLATFQNVQTNMDDYFKQLQLDVGTKVLTKNIESVTEQKTAFEKILKNDIELKKQLLLYHELLK